MCHNWVNVCRDFYLLQSMIKMGHFSYLMRCLWSYIHFCDSLRKFQWSLSNRTDTSSITVLKQLAVNRLIRKLMPSDITRQGLMEDSKRPSKLFLGLMWKAQGYWRFSMEWWCACNSFVLSKLPCYIFELHVINCKQTFQVTFMDFATLWCVSMILSFSCSVRSASYHDK